MIEIYMPGSRVLLSGGSDLQCRVIAVSLVGHEGHTTIRYEVSWVVGGDRKTAWIESFEIASSPEGKSQMGFIAS